jgi:hypothetical protein
MPKDAYLFQRACTSLEVLPQGGIRPAICGDVFPFAQTPLANPVALAAHGAHHETIIEDLALTSMVDCGISAFDANAQYVKSRTAK